MIKDYEMLQKIIKTFNREKRFTDCDLRKGEIKSWDNDRLWRAVDVLKDMDELWLQENDYGNVEYEILNPAETW